MHRSRHELGIDRLTVAERITLVQAIWDSVADSVQQLVPTAQEIAELDRRLDEDDLQPDDTTEWRDVKTAASRKWSRRAERRESSFAPRHESNSTRRVPGTNGSGAGSGSSF